MIITKNVDYQSKQNYHLPCCPVFNPQITGMFIFEVGVWVITNMSSAHAPPPVSSESDGPIISKASKSKRK